MRGAFGRVRKNVSLFGVPEGERQSEQSQGMRGGGVQVSLEMGEKDSDLLCRHQFRLRDANVLLGAAATGAVTGRMSGSEYRSSPQDPRH